MYIRIQSSSAQRLPKYTLGDMMKHKNKIDVLVLDFMFALLTLDG